MIKSFKDKITEDIYNGYNTKDARRIPDTVWGTACRKLDMLNAAHDLKDLLSLPGNKFEKLKGKLSEFYGIRINDQYRIIFKWAQGSVELVQIVDYH
ncbi:MAG: type II toxin-antitoxin system RelE/ParE family toxin [Elusimicrobia bacterium]|nr:type II toxin-antitoxin system RelE/ParE family toxin [Candidatus Liberimonas magnetica]